MELEGLTGVTGRSMTIYTSTHGAGLPPNGDKLQSDSNETNGSFNASINLGKAITNFLERITTYFITYFNHTTNASNNLVIILQIFLFLVQPNTEHYFCITTVLLITSCMQNEVFSLTQGSKLTFPL